MYCFYHVFCVAREKHFEVHFRRFRLVYFPLKDGKDLAHEKENGWKGSFSRQSGRPSFVNNMPKVHFPIL